MKEDLSVDSFGANDTYRDIYRRQSEILRSFSLFFADLSRSFSLIFRAIFRWFRSLSWTLLCPLLARYNRLLLRATATVSVLRECLMLPRARAITDRRQSMTITNLMKSIFTQRNKIKIRARRWVKCPQIMAKSSLRMYGKPRKPALLRWPRHCLPLSSCMLELKKWIRNELTCWERTYRYHATRYWHERREKVRKSNKPCVGSKVAGVEQLIDWRTRKILSNG